MIRLAAALLILAGCGAPAAVTLTADEERVLRPIPDAPDVVRRLVDRGDDLFMQALTPHHQNDVPAALSLYAKARSSYLEAQTHYSGIIPPPLLDRVRECVNRIAALQRQQHATK